MQQDAEKARMLAEQGAQACRDGLEQAAFGYYVQSLNLYRGLDDRPNIVRILVHLSYLSGWADFGDGLDMFQRRQKLGEEAIPLAREIGDKALLAKTLCAFSFGDEAQAMLEESIALAEASGDKAVLASALSALAKQTALLEAVAPAEAGGGADSRTLNEHALSLYEELGDQSGMAAVLFSLAIGADRAQKRAYLERALELRRAQGDKRRIYELLTLLQTSCDPEDLDRREAYTLEALELAREFGDALWQEGRLNTLARGMDRVKQMINRITKRGGFRGDTDTENDGGNAQRR